MARQLDLFAASRTTEYRNSHATVPRRLHTIGRGNSRVERRVSMITGKQSMRANKQRLASSLASARRSVSAVKYSLLKRNVKVKRSSFGSRGG